ncbi:MAG: ATP-binding protein [Thermoplasmata archaeon]
MGADAANVLFQVVNDRYLRRRPMVLTTNKPVEDWGKVLHDPDLAEAILDRVLERGRVLSFKGPSYRTRNLRVGDVPIISGKIAAEYQEPTALRGVIPYSRRKPRYTLRGAEVQVQLPSRRPMCSRETSSALRSWTGERGSMFESPPPLSRNCLNCGTAMEGGHVVAPPPLTLLRRQ